MPKRSALRQCALTAANAAEFVRIKMNGFVLQNNKNIWYGSFAAFDALGFGNAFSCRLHGESSLISGGLNLALHVGDEAGLVLKNRRAYAAALGLDAGKFTCCEQVHGSNVAVVDEALAGKGAEAYSDAVKNTDALITNLPQLPLMLFFADCVPLIFADPVSGSIGLAHAGWRGTVAGIAASTAAKMQEAFGAKPENILAGIGPSIGQCCYEVDDKVFEAGKKYAGCFTLKENGRYMADLQAWNRLALLDAGLLAQNIYNAGVCTQCDKELFFSYRAENGKTGRMGVTIWKK